MLKQTLAILNPKPFYSPRLFPPTLILVLAAVLPAIHIYFGSMAFVQRVFPQIDSFGASLYMFISMFIWLGLLPLLIVHFVFNEPLSNYGLRLGNWRQGIISTLILLAIIAVFFLYPSSHSIDFRQVYPFDRSAGRSILAFLRFEALRGLLFYSAWEFFFRGFMLFGLRKYVGDWLAICIQTIPSCLWHVGLPVGEILASIPAGIVFGIMALRMNSIFWVFWLHFLIGVVLDLFIVVF
ncbi:MAG: CPBP family intramembrane metalloprotease [candidate division KSB1 bacterium]|nr:CPBP family intramembrane metalloprotease [candidate division KSB1 bacterium]MDZ7342666.1 CPBP family intramembrane metalloprotease [candidate division KSB1 bacterium]